jgi:hypothetical protein
MQKLQENCPNLKEFNLKFVDLKLITVKDLPSKIESLQLKRCEIPVDWFANNKFTHLHSLDLSGSARTCTQHIGDLVQDCRTSLKTLILSDCYRIVDSSVDLLTNEFTNLVCLKINGTKCTSLSIHFICSRMKLIGTIDVRDCVGIPETDVNLLRTTFPGIKIFCNADYKLKV